eukprot:3021596-Rhodomonas_salina.2
MEVGVAQHLSVSQQGFGRRTIKLCGSGISPDGQCLVTLHLLGGVIRALWENPERFLFEQVSNPQIVCENGMPSEREDGEAKTKIQGFALSRRMLTHVCGLEEVVVA